MIIIERGEIIIEPIIESTTCVVFCVCEITTGKPTEVVRRHTEPVGQLPNDVSTAQCVQIRSCLHYRHGLVSVQIYQPTRRVHISRVLESTFTSMSRCKLSHLSLFSF